MPCPTFGSTASLVTGKPVNDWAGLHPYTPAGGIFTPSTCADVVAIVQSIESGGGRAKAVGSVYSLSTAPDSDGFVIDTKQLNRHLSQPFPTPPSALTTSRPDGSPRFATPAHNAQWLNTIARPGFPRSIHVQAGIKIHTLLNDLAGVGLALPTMGSGGGQSLAGALSTATHGSDVNLRLLGDAIRAIHLIGPGGQEWWIEANAGRGTGIDHSQLPDWCPDTKVVYDSDFLEAVRVGAGRFGVVQSLVLEVVAQYRLVEIRNETTWAETRSALLAAVASGYTAAGNIFADTLNGSRLRFWQVVIDQASASRAWITRRWRTTDPKTENIDRGLDLFGYLCTHRETTKIAVIGVVATLVSALAGISYAVMNLYGHIPIVGPAIASEKVAPYLILVAKLIEAIQSYSTLGNFLFTVADLLRNADLPLGQELLDDALRQIAGAVLEAEHDPPTRRGASHEILDTHNYNLDGCFSVNSAEFFFDAASTAYIDFVDAVLGKAQELGPLMGVVALRFTRRTRSKIGMQRFALTVAIEVAMPRPGSVNEGFKAAVHSLALQQGGIPHWGQEHSLTSEDVERLYGGDLDVWRWALAETEVKVQQTFSSAFTRARGLEPRESLSAYRARRYIAAVVSGTI